MKKRYYVDLPIFIVCTLLLLIGIAGFIWESIDVGRFVVFSFVTQIVFPLIIVIVTSFLLLSYVILDDNKVVQKSYGKIIKEFKWEEIKEIKLEGTYVYISKTLLNCPKKEWDRKDYIYLFYSEALSNELKSIIKKNNITSIKVNF